MEIFGVVSAAIIIYCHSSKLTVSFFPIVSAQGCATLSVRWERSAGPDEPPTGVRVNSRRVFRMRRVSGSSLNKRKRWAMRDDRREIRALRPGDARPHATTTAAAKRHTHAQLMIRLSSRLTRFLKPFSFSPFFVLLPSSSSFSLFSLIASPRFMRYSSKRFTCINSRAGYDTAHEKC